MNMPGFTADASLYQTSGYYYAVSTRGTTNTKGSVTAASWFCDLFPWFPGCGGTPMPKCEHTDTETYCTGFVNWCKDNYRCWDSRGNPYLTDGGWYVCGACFGWG